MAEYPQFVFMYNQSVLFDFLKKTTRKSGPAWSSG
jgi:hypothetical protein